MKPHDFAIAKVGSLPMREGRQAHRMQRGKLHEVQKSLILALIG